MALLAKRAVVGIKVEAVPYTFGTPAVSDTICIPAFDIAVRRAMCSTGGIHLRDAGYGHAFQMICSDCRSSPPSTLPLPRTHPF